MGGQYPVWHEVPFAVRGGHTLGCMRAHQVGQELMRARPYRNVKAQTRSAAVCGMGIPVSVREEWVVGWVVRGYPRGPGRHRGWPEQPSRWDVEHDRYGAGHQDYC